MLQWFDVAACSRGVLAAAVGGLVVFAGVPAVAQVATKAPPAVAGARPAVLERIVVHSPAIEGNLEGDSADRPVIVVLPPSYNQDSSRPYPVVYALHGYSIGPEQWIGEIHVPASIENAFASGAQEMIVVLPDSKTMHNGSMYSGSQTTGDFETFISRDLVQHIDANYRTIPDRASRGLVGHSMGGYGAARIGIKHADVFGALYLMSPCCFSAREPAGFDPQLEAKVAALKSPAESASLEFPVRGVLAMAAAFSPNPQKPPLYLDLPVKNGAPDPAIMAKWQANSIFNFLDQYIPNMRLYAAIAMDVGDRDGLKTDTQGFHEALERYGIASTFELYDGDHTSEVAIRMQEHVIPFFARHLAGPAGR